jgi:hypothetical protein
MSAELSNIFIDELELRAEVSDLKAEMNALKAWLRNPLFVARLLQQLLWNEPDMRQAADLAVQALQDDLKAHCFEYCEGGSVKCSPSAPNREHRQAIWTNLLP